MNPTPTHSWVDVLQTIKRLQPRDQVTLRRMMQLLGYTIEARIPPESQKPTQIHTPPQTKHPTGNQTSPPKTQTPTPTRKSIPSTLTAHVENQHQPPAWLDTVPRLEEATQEHRPEHLPLDPLFRPNWTRAILSDALATPGYNGEIDIERMIQIVSQAQPLTTLPRRQSPTLSRGVQILVDCSDALQPFARDQILLQQVIHKVIGHHNCQTLLFNESPLWGAGSDARDDWSTYQPPSPGTPVLVLTDLGIGDSGAWTERSDVSDWQALAFLLREQECPLIAFVPYPEHRWPVSLRNTLTILPWDRWTNASTVRRIIGRTRSH